ncbi:Rare lipoprotein A [uncultured Caudovirales phage]|uniref:Rare lipoprotein A n=1 Tax=uncultured Caudovirales phage TaxID=2100421 RepID=A0A6J5N7S5_9CAUD|nr:Rare lipoprotein A [uncultured Caudovirales phage]
MKRIIIILMCFYCLTSFKASYYHSSFHGKVTKSGEIYNENKLTCASNTHKLGTRLKVTNLENGKSVIVKVTDTGSFSKVTLDLSKKAFERIAELEKGIINIKIKKI